MVAAVSREGTGLGIDGYVVVPGFLDSQLAGTLRREIPQLLETTADGECKRPHNTLVALRWKDEIVGLILRDRVRREQLRSVLAADDLRWISGYVSVKEPRTPPLWWHQDWWCWDHPVSYGLAPVQVALLIYLTETDQRNGALRVIPGSHLRSMSIHSALPEAHAQDDPPRDHPALQDHSEQITVEARCGDAVIIDYRLLHGTHSNESDERRESVLLSFTPSWRSLPGDIRGHLIQHTALPSSDESVLAGSWESELLPSFSGPRADLELNRVPPSHFVLQ